MDQLSVEVRQESPCTMMFADDIVICSESREQVEENLERWRFALERRGMKVSGRSSRGKLDHAKGGRASPNASSSSSDMSKSQNPSLSEFLKAKKISPFRAPSSTVTPLSASAPGASTHMDPSGFSSGYSSSEEGYGRSSSPHSTPTSSAHTPADEKMAGRGVLTALARAFAVVYFRLGVAWYSITSGMSLLDVSLLSRCTAGMRKTLLLSSSSSSSWSCCFSVCVVTGVWYWYPYVTALFPRSARAPLVQPRPTTHTHTQPREVTFLRERCTGCRSEDELQADLHEREMRWLEDRGRDLEDVVKEIELLKQDGEKQKHAYEMLAMDVQNLRIRARSKWIRFRSESGHVQTQSASEHLSHRMDAQESENRKLKAELSDWLLQQMSVSVQSQPDGVTRPELQGRWRFGKRKSWPVWGKEGEDKERRDVWRTVGTTLQEEGVGAVTVTDVEGIVRRALSLHRAEGIGMADYALESSGASVINTRCSETYHTRSACISLFGFPLWYPSESPRTVIQPELYPGKCWPFRGSEGSLVIALSHAVHITHITLEHLPRVLSPTGHIDSAPKDFAVYGMINHESEEGNLLGTFVYDQDGESIQTYQVQHSLNEMFRLVELRILSNWGHPEYTCVYRFRVHGQPAST
ncbi:hypothetical protein QTP70_023756 [Hemibagrus guttatus]|uniref:SUN domain-containing protein n=1 Tax=Hemibagrus guttatus TaxID=175788 RepID=A0AAE0PXP2_9TELE|nr:hypothetical protein QTP70_023756 [Hemibagrus guttatus]